MSKPLFWHFCIRDHRHYAENKFCRSDNDHYNSKPLDYIGEVNSKYV